MLRTVCLVFVRLFFKAVINTFSLLWLKRKVSIKTFFHLSINSAEMSPVKPDKMARIWNINTTVTEGAAFSTSVSGPFRGLFLERGVFAPPCRIVNLCLISRVRSVLSDWSSIPLGVVSYPAFTVSLPRYTWLESATEYVRNCHRLFWDNANIYEESYMICCPPCIFIPVWVPFVGFFFFAQEEALCNSTTQSNPLGFFFCS